MEGCIMEVCIMEGCIIEGCIIEGCIIDDCIIEGCKYITGVCIGNIIELGKGSCSTRVFLSTSTRVFLLSIEKILASNSMDNSTFFRFPILMRW
jgi:hypothetical protein